VPLKASRSAGFLTFEGCALYCANWAPPDNRPRRGRIVILQPFAEEMNRARHVIAAAARHLAVSGFEVVIPDLTGTGDSEGDFGDASVARWIDDVSRLFVTFDDAMAIHLVGIRFGGLLASAVDPLERCASLTLVEPIVEGRQILRHFDRLSRAKELAAVNRSGGQVPTTGAQEPGLEVAGYHLSSSMRKELEKLKLADFTLPNGLPLNWLAIPPRGDAQEGLPTHSATAGLFSRSAQVNRQKIQCERFWMTQELTDCPTLADGLVKVLGA
jgi:exosortase A-associated hydrolase 2